MRFRPCIDIHAGVVKQIVGSTLTDSNAPGAVPATNFVAQQPPEYFAGLYRKHGLAGGHVIMLGKGCEEAALSALKAWPGNLQIGGGINADNARFWLDAGASHIIVTSWIFHDGICDTSRLQQLVNLVGKERLVLDLSCKKTPCGYFVATDRWQKISQQQVTIETLQEFSRFAGEFLVHAVDVEGKRSGIDGELLKILAKSPIQCVYAGGVSCYQDIDRIAQLGSNAVDYTIGSALDIFGGEMNFDRIVAMQEAIKD